MSAPKLTEAQRLAALRGRNEHVVGPQWILDGAGPARFGFGVVEPLGVRYLCSRDAGRAALKEGDE